MIIPFGEHFGKTFDQVASTDEGLLWLDRLVDDKTLPVDFREALEEFLKSPDVARDLDRLTE